MGYSFMSIEKIKTMTAVGKKYAHNLRTVAVENADPSLIHLNEELVGLEGKTYAEALQERLKSLGYGSASECAKDPSLKKIRKNAVLGLEIVTTFSRGDKERIDIEKWKKDNVAWLKKTFNANVKKYGDNVLSVVYHGDETGNVHCHAFIVPIDDKGHLNANYYMTNRRKMIEMQDSYGKLMKENHGLKRGLKGSTAKHTDIKKYYAALNNAIEMELPQIDMNETAAQYRERAQKVFEQNNLRALSLEKENERLKVEKEYMKSTAAKDVRMRVAENYQEAFDRLYEFEQEFGSVDKAKEMAEKYKEIEGSLKKLPAEEYNKEKRRFEEMVREWQTMEKKKKKYVPERLR